MSDSSASAPWERQPYESAASFALFQLYLSQDLPRSITAAYATYRARKGLKPARNAPGSWRNLAAGKTRNGVPIEGGMTWISRALAWDDYIADQERQKWIKRRLELKEQEWTVGTSLLEKGKDMLALTQVSDWKPQGIAQAVSVGSKLARLSADMATDNIELDWREEAKKEGIDPDAIFNRLVDELAARMERSDDAGSDGGGESQSDPQES